MGSADRFCVTYRIFTSDAAEARERALAIALEQTVEIPDAVVPAGFIRDEIVGQIVTISPAGQNAFDAVISYSAHSVGYEVIQLINVVFGNSSIQQGIKVIAFELGAALKKRFVGARFGIKGMRERVGRNSGGLISPVIKPQGSTPTELALIASRCVAGGADIIKDDHGLTNQAMAPFEERLKAVSNAVNEANAKNGTKAQYFVNISGYTGNPVEEAYQAKQAGAGGVLLMPGLLGFGIAQRLAADPSFGLPIMTHPAFTGPFVLSPTTGLTHAMMYGTLQRLMGSDISVFPNVGGRFGFSKEECLSIAHDCRNDDGIGAPIMPSPGGGMSVERASDMVQMYGDDVVYLLGGSLLRHGDKIGDAVKAMRDAVETASQ